MSSNEIIVRIAVDCAAFAISFIMTILAFKLALERRAAAHKREIAELRECLKEAVREKCPFTRMSCRYGEQCDYECGTVKWRKALKGINNAIEDAIAAIRRKEERNDPRK